MADLKISQLPSATTPLAGTEVLPIVQSSTTKKVSVDNLTAGRAVSALSLSLTNALTVGNGGSGATTLTGYVKGNGTSAFTASSTIPNTDITGLGTISTQAANNVAITGGSITGTGPIYTNNGSFSASGGSTTTITTLANTNVQKNYYIMVSQEGATINVVFALLNAYGASASAFRVYQDNTNPVTDMNITTSGLNVQLVIGAGFGTTTWRWYLVQFGG